MVKVLESLKEMYPEASIGFLIIKNLKNDKGNVELKNKKDALENSLRNKYKDYSRTDFKNLENIKVYNQYYKKFKKTYHVLMQLESIVTKGRSLPNVDSLVEAMFMAEVKNQLLTAGHDIAKLKSPIEVNVSKGDEEYILMNGKKQMCAEKDMYMKDSEGIISSIIYGPDDRTKIDLNTTEALYIVYGPEGISKKAIKQHLQDIVENVSLVSKDCIVEKLEVI